MKPKHFDIVLPDYDYTELDKGFLQLHVDTCMDAGLLVAVKLARNFANECRVANTISIARFNYESLPVKHLLESHKLVRLAEDTVVTDVKSEKECMNIVVESANWLGTTRPAADFEEASKACQALASCALGVIAQLGDAHKQSYDYAYFVNHTKTFLMGLGTKMQGYSVVVDNELNLIIHCYGRPDPETQVAGKIVIFLRAPT